MTHHHNHGHSFDPENWRKLESEERRERMNPGKLAQAMGLMGDEVVLDIGVGTGFFAAEVAPLCARLVGVDHSSRMLDIFRSKEIFPKLANVELMEGKAENLSVPPASVDVVFHVNLFHEVEDMEAFHAGIKRALKPGGRLFMVDWHSRPTQGGPPPEHRIPEEKAMALLEKDGFKNIRKLNLYQDHYAFSAEIPR